MISDISVSRYHAFIKFQNGRFSLFDKNSKFGTLVQLKEPLEVQKDKIGIQCGRTLITFTMREERTRDEDMEMIERVSRLAEMSTKASQGSRRSPAQKKKTPSMKSITKKNDNRDGGSEGTLDVERDSSSREKRT